jgi:hypothetical protein
MFRKRPESEIQLKKLKNLLEQKSQRKRAAAAT